MRATLDRVESTAWFVTAVLGATMSLRLFIVVAGRAFAGGPDVPLAVAPTSGARPPHDRLERVLDLTRPEDDAGAAPNASAGFAAPLIRPQLYVNVGPERSTVYVNGVNAGQTPFIGEVTCRSGDLVEVDVDPPQGAPMRFAGRCQGTLLRVEKDE